MKMNNKLQEGDKYYVITKQKTIIWAWWGDRPDFDERMQAQSNVFLTIEEASQALEEGFVYKHESYCKVSTKKLARLLRDANTLRRLECAGVDNWLGYDIAMDGSDIDEEPINEYNDLDDEVLTKNYERV